MPDPISSAVLVVAALVGSTVGGIAGFGAGVILLPVLGLVLGVRAAVVTLTVTMLLGNVSRIWWSRADIQWPVVRRYLAGAVPGTALGVLLFAGASSVDLSLAIGLFLIAAVPLRRVLLTRRFTVRLPHFAPLGAVTGLISALVVTTGPMITPFFLAYGLRRGGFIATEAACALAMHLVRGAGFATLALITRETALLGLILGATMFAGSWLGRRIVDRLSDRAFLGAIEALLVLMGLHFLIFPR
jgi:uncharacterized membrane protein YfcA